MSLITSVVVKILQIITSAAALIVKKLSDSHSERVFTRNQKFSTEWTLLNNLTWTKEGNDFTTLTFLGYLFISSVLLLARFLTGSLMWNPSEKIFLFFGVLFYVLECFIIFTSLEYLPVELQNYAIILGSLSLFGSLLFLIDFLNIGKKIQQINKIIQTDNTAVNQTQFLQTTSPMESLKTQCCNNQVSSFNYNKKYLRTDL